MCPLDCDKQSGKISCCYMYLKHTEIHDLNVYFDMLGDVLVHFSCPPAATHYVYVSKDAKEIKVEYTSIKRLSN